MSGERATAGDQGHVRLFVAVAIPPAVARIVDDAIAPWKARFPDVRWAVPSDRHVTVRFLGPTDPDDVPWLRGRLTQVSAGNGPFEVRVSGLGSFPSAGRARVLWAGLDDPVGGLDRLAREIGAAVAPRFADDGRPYRPHLTLARSGTPLRLPSGFRDALQPSAPFTVGGFDLIRSHLGGGRPRYERLGSFRLAA